METLYCKKVSLGEFLLGKIKFSNGQINNSPHYEKLSRGRILHGGDFTVTPASVMWCVQAVKESSRGRHVQASTQLAGHVTSRRHVTSWRHGTRW